MTSVSTRTVILPACKRHEGSLKFTATLPWVCIFCGQPRGEPELALSYDGSRGLEVHKWENPCGHIETYEAVRQWLNFTAEIGELPQMGQKG